MSLIQTDATPIRKRIVSTSCPPSFEPEASSHVDVKIDDLEEKRANFVERHELLITATEYSRDAKDPGLVLIFNQVKFDDDDRHKFRFGSNKDVNELVMCLGRLGFNITERNIYNNLTKRNLLETIQNVVEVTLPKNAVNCLIVFFFTHGSCGNIIEAADGRLDANEIWSKFFNCPHLNGRPKMFVFQACKGPDESTIGEQATKRAIIVPRSTFKANNSIGPDMLIVYSGTEGNSSFRHPIHGTWFIQELCRNFNSYGRRDDVISLLIRTTKCVSTIYYNIDKVETEPGSQIVEVVQKQIPVFISTLSKKFYLNRNKDRDFLIALGKRYDTMEQDMQELKTALHRLNSAEEERNRQKKS